jgi:hypothetical protein
MSMVAEYVHAGSWQTQILKAAPKYRRSTSLSKCRCPPAGGRHGANWTEFLVR